MSDYQNKNAKKRILIVEDEAIVASDIKTTLLRAGYEIVDILSTGEMAIEVSQKKSPDLVLMDIKLIGQMDGIEAAKKIKEFNIPVVYLTALGDRQTIERAKETMPQGYLYKPFDAKDLLMAVELAIHKSELEIPLRESEKKYRYLVENSNELILIISKTGKILFANKYACKISGYTREELIGNSIAKFLTKDSFIKAMKILAAEFRGQVQLGFEIEFKAKNGDLKIIELQDGTNFVKEGDRVIGLLVNGHDITKRREMEKQLKESEEKFRILLENAPIGIYYNDFSGNFLYGNKKAEEITGYKREQLIGKSFLKLKLLSSKDLLKAASILALNKKGKLNKPQIFTIKRKDGEERKVEITNNFVTIGGKKAMMGMVQDVTFRHEAKRSLQESEERYRTIVANIPGMVYHAGPDWVPTIISKNVSQITGYSREELLSRKINWLDLIHPEDRESIIKESGNQEKTGGSLVQEYRIVKKDKSIAWIQDRKTLTQEQGKLICIDGVVNDITEQKNKEEKSKIQNKELEKANKIMVGRELKMIELKKRVKKLEENK